MFDDMVPCGQSQTRREPVGLAKVGCSDTGVGTIPPWNRHNMFDGRVARRRFYDWGETID